MMGLGDTVKHIIKFESNMGTITLKKNCTRAKAWKVVAVTGKGYGR